MTMIVKFTRSNSRSIDHPSLPKNRKALLGAEQTTMSQPCKARCLLQSKFNEMITRLVGNSCELANATHVHDIQTQFSPKQALLDTPTPSLQVDARCGTDDEITCGHKSTSANGAHLFFPAGLHSWAFSKFACHGQRALWMPGTRSRMGTHACLHIISFD
jgi:hypothetical protein